MLTLAAKTGHSRFPVMAPGSHSVEGIIHIRRTLAVPYRERGQQFAADHMSEATLVPDTIELDELMDLLRADGLQLAVLIDETGDVAGLLTLEDLVEEIVGDVCEIDTAAEYEKPAARVTLRVEEVDGARISLLRADVAPQDGGNGWTYLESSPRCCCSARASSLSVQSLR